MTTSQPPSDPLRSALRELAEADAAEVIEQARGRARARAGKLIEDALLDELLAAAGRPRTEAGRAGRAEAVRQREDVDRGRPSEPAWWTYCVLSARDAAKVPSHLEGIEPGSRVEALCEGELAALISPVPAMDYDDVRLRQHLEDLDWIERTARRHEAVLEGVLPHVSIVPLRLCTLYRDRAGVRRLLDEHAESLLGSLEKVAGCAEWGVKVFAGGSVPADPDARDEGPVAEPDSEAQDALARRPGATYLMRRQRDRERADRAVELRARCAEAVHRRASVCARESTTNPPQRPELHGRDMSMLLNGAYLVADDRTDDLYQAVRDLQAEWEPLGFVVELTGPWPAYNFVSGATGVMP